METLELPATIAVDRNTAERLRQLAAVWQVTPEEALSRAVERVETAHSERPDPAAVLAAYHAKGGFGAEKAKDFSREVDENRKNWGPE